MAKKKRTKPLIKEGIVNMAALMKLVRVAPKKKKTKE